MPVLLKIKLFGKVNGASPSQIHGAFFSLLYRVSNKLFSEVHPMEPKPFSLYLVGNTIRLSLLSDEIAEKFLKESINMERIRLGKRNYIVEKIEIDDNKILDFKDIISQAKAKKTIEVEFITPTTFRTGDIDTPLPLPRFVFSNWLWKWNAFCQNESEKIPNDVIRYVEEMCFISNMNIHSEIFDTGKEKIIGFVGRCTFSFSRILPEVRKYLNALADFAEFAGTGRKTTYGMGLTKRLS